MKKFEIEENINLVKNFFQEFKKNNKFEKYYFLDFYNLKILPILKNENDFFPNNMEKNIVIFNNIIKNIKSKNFDLIISILPICMYNEKSEYKRNYEYEIILNLLNQLNENGVGLFILPEGFNYYRTSKNFLECLEKNNIFLNGILELPKNILYPLSNINMNLFLFEKKKIKKIFIGNIENECQKILIDNYLKKNNQNNLKTGLIIEKENFINFDSYRSKIKKEDFLKNYVDYKKVKFYDLIKKISHLENYNDINKNKLYLQNMGIIKIISNIEEIKNKKNLRDIFELEINENLIKKEYLELFFKSILGIETLNEISIGGYIKTISKKNLEKIIIPLPSKIIQKEIIGTYTKLEKIKKILCNFEKEISLNYDTHDKILPDLNNILNSMGKLNKKDKIKQIISEGENAFNEFKSTFSKNLKTGKKDDEIIKSSLKTIVGFLNTEGGNLIIGVEDNKNILGIKKDFYKNDDDYLLNFLNHLKTKIGMELVEFVEYEIIELFNEKIFFIKVKKNSKPSFYEDKEFFIRGNPATQKLEGSKLQKYIKLHFKQK